MLTIALKFAYGEAVAREDHPNIVIQELGRRIVRLIPRAEVHKYEELKDVYEQQAKALAAA